MEKRAKGLCYRCNEKFALRHRCKQRELQVLMVLDEEEKKGVEIGNPKMIEIEGNFLEIRGANVEVEDNRPRGVGLSLKSVVGFNVVK